MGAHTTLVKLVRVPEALLERPSRWVVVVDQLVEVVYRVVRGQRRPVPALHRAYLLHGRRAHLGHTRAWREVCVQASVGREGLHPESESEERRREGCGRSQSVLKNHLLDRL